MLGIVISRGVFFFDSSRRGFKSVVQKLCRWRARIADAASMMTFTQNVPKRDVNGVPRPISSDRFVAMMFEHRLLIPNAIDTSAHYNPHQLIECAQRHAHELEPKLCTQVRICPSVMGCDITSLVLTKGLLM